MRFLFSIASTHFGVKGLYIGIARSLALPFFKLRGVTGQRYHDFMTVSMLPWACKPFIGAVSDAVFVLGYSKRYYITFAAIIAALVALLLAVVDVDALTAAGLFTLANVGVMVVDLLMEGKYSELMAVRAKGRPEIVTYVWIMCMTGVLVASASVGPLADRGWISTICWIAFGAATQAIFPPLLGWVPETREGKRCISVKKEKLFEHKHLFALATSMGLVAMGLVFVTLFSNYIGKLVYSVLGSIFLLTLTFRVLPKRLAKCNCYLFLQDSLSISLAGAIEYFFTANETCLPDGPNFSYLFFFTCKMPPLRAKSRSQKGRVVSGVLGVWPGGPHDLPMETQDIQDTKNFYLYHGAAGGCGHV